MTDAAYRAPALLPSSHWKAGFAFRAGSVLQSSAHVSYKTATLNHPDPLPVSSLYPLYQYYDPPKLALAGESELTLPPPPPIRPVQPVSASNSRYRVFPLPYVCIPHPTVSTSRRCRTRYRMSMHYVSVTNRLIDSINGLSRSFHTAPRSKPFSHGTVSASNGDHYYHSPNHPSTARPNNSIPPNAKPNRTPFRAAFDPSSTDTDVISNICPRLLAICSDYVDGIVSAGSRLYASLIHASSSGVGAVPIPTTSHPSVVRLLLDSPLRALLLSRSKRATSGASSGTIRGSQSRAAINTGIDNSSFAPPPPSVASSLHAPRSVPDNSVGPSPSPVVPSYAVRGVMLSASAPYPFHLRRPPLHQPLIVITTLYCGSVESSAPAVLPIPFSQPRDLQRSGVASSPTPVLMTASVAAAALPSSYCNYYQSTARTGQPINTSSTSRGWVASRSQSGDQDTSSGSGAITSGGFGDAYDTSMDEWLFDSVPAAGAQLPGGLPIAFTRSYSRALSVQLIASQISLPPDCGGAVPLLLNLPPDYSRRYADPSQMLIQQPAAAAIDAVAKFGPPRAHSCSRSQYVALISRIRGLNMATLTRYPKVVNGLFAVPKDAGSQRLIIDARYANVLFRKPDRVTLPTPDVITELFVNASDTLYVGKCDLADFYHSMELPEWMMPYFCLPPVSYAELGLPGDGFVYPMLRTLPMGFSHAVLLAQLVHEHAIASAGLYADSPPVARLSSSIVGGGIGLGRILTYIDDVLFFGTNQQTTERVQDRYELHMARCGFKSKQCKRVRPTSKPVDCLGVTVHGALRRVGVSTDELARVISETVQFASQPLCSGHALSRIIGAWTWMFLLNRSALSVFSSVYRFISTAGHRSIPLWHSVLNELVVTIDIAPLLQSSLDLSALSDMVCTDSSTTGLGVVVTQIPPAIVRPLAASTVSAHLMALDARRIPGMIDAIGESIEPFLLPLSDAGIVPTHHYRPSAPFALYYPGQPRYLPCVTSAAIMQQHLELSDSDSAAVANTSENVLSLLSNERFYDLYRSIAQRSWRTVVSSEWRFCADEHINAKEIRAVETGLRYVLFSRNSSALDSRFIAFMDSAVALFALTKGRSSSPVLLRRARAVAALLLATGMRPFYRYIATGINPADAPSREHPTYAATLPPHVMYSSNDFDHPSFSAS